MDPLIHGPGAGAVEGAGPDLNRTSPAEDFLLLLRSPRQFFDFFRGDPVLSKWLIFKALGGMLFFSWLAEFARGGQWANALIRQIRPLISPQNLRMLNLGVDPMVLQAKLLTGLIAVAHVWMFAAPLWDLIDLVGIAASIVLFLPLVGVSRSKVSFHTVFIATAFARWLYVVGVIPGIGRLTPILIIVYTVWAVKRISGLGAARAFVATYFLYWLSLLLIPLLAIIMLGIFFLLPHS